jgi:hypothetical protein
MGDGIKGRSPRRFRLKAILYTYVAGFVTACILSQRSHARAIASCARSSPSARLPVKNHIARINLSYPARKKSSNRALLQGVRFSHGLNRTHHRP